jgi:hypothetical protein
MRGFLWIPILIFLAAASLQSGLDAGDLGYSYGTADWTDGGTAVKANYLRIWVKRGGAWKLAVDCVSEVPVS